MRYFRKMCTYYIIYNCYFQTQHLSLGDEKNNTRKIHIIIHNRSFFLFNYTVGNEYDKSVWQLQIFNYWILCETVRKLWCNGIVLQRFVCFPRTTFRPVKLLSDYYKRIRFPVTYFAQEWRGNLRIFQFSLCVKSWEEKLSNTFVKSGGKKPIFFFFFEHFENS